LRAKADSPAARPEPRDSAPNVVRKSRRLRPPRGGGRRRHRFSERRLSSKRHLPAVPGLAGSLPGFKSTELPAPPPSFQMSTGGRSAPPSNFDSWRYPLLRRDRGVVPCQAMRGHTMPCRAEPRTALPGHAMFTPRRGPANLAGLRRLEERPQGHHRPGVPCLLRRQVATAGARPAEPTRLGEAAAANSSNVSRTRCVIAAGTSSRAKVTVRWKPCGPVISTRTPS